ncbi:DUF3888 domain-containing protein [Paenibacillus oceani]|uniref:DUF3888 domain-containing protein n=1 Tax=Paenibacillus oceani TaxID=2772510 RepID=A0A927H1D6_9BACL|nr:DUF3888 domain-containing protein [Paenibacillus oceani]MBD2863374.1 DUF3888 domain-containing protein [Paenibacillus oceani]
MRVKLIISVLVLILLVTWPCYCVTNANNKPQVDSRELQFQDMLVLFLLPYMDDKLAEAYSNVLHGTPDLYPYFVDVVQAELLNGFRGFHFLIKLEATPTVGPHIPAGKDLFTFEINASGVKLIKFEHLKGPDKKDFPPNYQDLLK